MLDDTDLIVVRCFDCGEESTKQVGWLKRAAGDLLCQNCGAPVEYQAHELERMIQNESRNTRTKLWVYARKL